ncbi:hypothetical protein CHUAL_003816 [Chamberlinius hualienensis]
MSTRFGYLFAFVILIIGNRSSLVLTLSLLGIESSCETLPSTIHVSKEVTDENGQLLRTCEGEVAVNKCEGTCSSQLQPSVVQSSGFLKDCQCCRESHLREREVVLQTCYNAEGQPLPTGSEHSQLVIRLKEPALCKCYKCGSSDLL